LERAAANLEVSFTGPLARSLALVAIVLGGLMFRRREAASQGSSLGGSWADRVTPALSSALVTGAATTNASTFAGREFGWDWPAVLSGSLYDPRHRFLSEDLDGFR
jgi:hypothetical protein